MSKKEKPSVKIGTIGHVDHGRVTLTEQIKKAIEMGQRSGSNELYDWIDKDIKDESDKEKRVKSK